MLPVERLVRSTEPGTRGVISWPLSGSSIAWTRWPDLLTVRYGARGRGWVESFVLSGHVPGLGGRIVLAHCPACDGRTRSLFLDLDLGGFRCRACCGLRYRSQYDARARRLLPGVRWPRWWREPVVEIRTDG